VDPALRDDAMLYPGDAVRATLRPVQFRDSELARAESRMWTRFEFRSAK
jgi:hypothetical protein